MVNSGPVSTAEWNEFINSAYTELWDELVTADQDYFFKQAPAFNLATGIDTYRLPLDFYKLRGVDLYLGSVGNFFPLHRFEWEERGRYSNALVGGSTANGQLLKYNIQGTSNIIFRPVPDGTQQIVVWYVPVAPPLVSDQDVIDGVNGWEEYVVIDAAIQAKQKSQEDVTILMQRKEAMKRRIQNASKARDMAEPRKMGGRTEEQDDRGYRYALPWLLPLAAAAQAVMHHFIT